MAPTTHAERAHFVSAMNRTGISDLSAPQPEPGSLAKAAQMIRSAEGLLLADAAGRLAEECSALLRDCGGEERLSRHLRESLSRSPGAVRTLDGATLSAVQDDAGIALVLASRTSKHEYHFGRPNGDQILTMTGRGGDEQASLILRGFQLPALQRAGGRDVSQNDLPRAQVRTIAGDARSALEMLYGAVRAVRVDADAPSAKLHPTTDGKMSA